MFKNLIFLLSFFAVLHPLQAQDLPNELKSRLNKPNSDSSLVADLEEVINFYREKNRDSAIHYINLAIATCEKNNQLLMPLWYKTMYSNQLLARKMFAAAFKLLNEIERKSQDLNRQNSTWKITSNGNFDQNKYLLLAATYYNYQILMSQTSNPELVRFYIQKTRENADLSSPSRFNSGSSSALAFLMLKIKKPDSAIHILNLIKEYDSVSVYFRDFDNMLKGIAYSDLHQYAESNTYLRLALKIADSKNIATRSAFRLSQNYAQLNQVDSAYFYARYLLDTLSSFGFSNFEVDLGVAYKNMYDCFNLMNKKDSAFKYAQLALKVQDSLNSIRIKNLAEFQQLLLSENRRIEALDDERNEKVSRWTNIGAISFALLIGLIAILLYRNVRQSRLANASLIEQKEKLQLTLDQLKSTQSQLVQSEKMASLGELTAGIAHEIQNPLNFVNNFSEVSTELVKEMVQEVEKGNTEEVKAIANDVVQNLEKINHHGQRASDIVKGMLQHSRSSNGVKEPTDINALADEYLRLAYHGLRAKDKSFNATMKTDFDETIGNINIIPQDIGRVILNLITNAFYAVNEKSKQGIADYEPTVSVSTKRLNDKVEIKVTDNGNGIPPSILDKIFQPFFTTKPTGQGTGLGLSLSYDIVKAHGGELKVETLPAEAVAQAGKEGEGSEFIILLPV
jgi:two-component system, NtrC family, sensor kinase